MTSSAPPFFDHPSAMEPLFPATGLPQLEALAIQLVEKSARLSGVLNPFTRNAIAELLRPMNSYYSNLIEGHDTHPLDIARALEKNYSSDVKRRNLQLEAMAHIDLHRDLGTELREVQTGCNPASGAFLRSIHRRFYAKLPDNFLKISKPAGGELRLIPGEYRTEEVEVGDHVAPASSSLSAFMQRFEQFYNPGSPANQSAVKRVINIAASHHRLAWIHPFLDGNGRVVRLFSDALFMMEDLDAGGLWTISRGLARGNDVYKTALARADEKRLADVDGRGNLSDKRLVEFCAFFLDTAVDQTEFMFSLLDVQRMLDRIRSFTRIMTARKLLRPESEYILADLFLRGRVTKQDAMRVTGLSDKTLKLMVDDLIRMNLLKAQKEGIYTMYYASYPLDFSPFLFPDLLPANKEAEMVGYVGGVERPLTPFLRHKRLSNTHGLY